MDLELKRMFVAIGRMLIENNYLGKSFLLLTILILAATVFMVYKD